MISAASRIIMQYADILDIRSTSVPYADIFGIITDVFRYIGQEKQ